MPQVRWPLWDLWPVWDLWPMSGTAVLCMLTLQIPAGSNQKLEPVLTLDALHLSTCHVLRPPI